MDIKDSTFTYLDSSNILSGSTGIIDSFSTVVQNENDILSINYVSQQSNTIFDNICEETKNGNKIEDEIVIQPGMKSCIAGLTRGYKNLSEYHNLIKRNKHIVSNLNDKTLDILIFHEGNIEENHQTYIKNETPELKIKFIDISDIAFRPEKNNIIITEGHGFGLGYRHMCSFWFVDFWDAVKEYDILFRLDEDCFIDYNIDTILVQLEKYNFIVACTSEDAEVVTRGLNNFSLDFIDRNKDNFTFCKSDPRMPGGPYTNLFGLSLNKIRNNTAFQMYKDEISKSNKIYEKRWGDLPVWGEVIYYIFGEDTMKIDENIKYFHGSHNAEIHNKIIKHFKC
jgi:hypothetical protein